MSELNVSWNSRDFDESDVQNAVFQSLEEAQSVKEVQEFREYWVYSQF